MTLSRVGGCSCVRRFREGTGGCTPSREHMSQCIKTWVQILVSLQAEHFMSGGVVNKCLYLHLSLPLPPGFSLPLPGKHIER